MQDVEIRHFHLFAGLGGGALGFNRGRAELNGLRAKFRCIGGVDVMPAAIRDFEKLSGCRGTVLDMFDREQYLAFHDTEPPTGWREATPGDIRNAAGNERPHIVFLSAPCKGFSGLLSESRSKTGKYQALNRLTLRGMFLMLEAWADDPPELIIFENVPRIATRGRALLDQIGALLRHYGYAVAETFHDCGEIGGLAQSRKRFLLVARHAEKVRPFLYEPPKRPLRAVGEILDKLPMPGDLRGGAMHSLPNLQWKTWVRLAFVEAGSDWRSLNKLRVEDGQLKDYLLMPERWYNGTLGVTPWDSAAGTVTGNGRPMTGSFSVADPRGYGDKNVYRICRWDEYSPTISGGHGPSSGGMSIADPRLIGETPRYNNVYRIIPWNEAAQAVSGGTGPSAGGLGVQDPRPPAGPMFSKYAVTPWGQRAGTVIGGDDQGAYAVADPRPVDRRSSAMGVVGWDKHSGTVAGESLPSNGCFAVADPRPTAQRAKGDHYLTNGNYGVVPWDQASGAVSASAGQDNGRWSVADPRIEHLPPAAEKLVCVIRALDGTWHRPFTTLELAALQSLVDPDNLFDLDGDSDSAKRERIGNAVPPGAAQAIADLMGQTLLLAWSGETFALSSTPIWVRPVAVSLSVRGQA